MQRSCEEASVPSALGYPRGRTSCLDERRWDTGMAGVNARSRRAERVEQNTSGNGSAGSMTGCVQDMEHCHLLVV